MYFVYVLKSLKDDKHYIGYSQNVHLRLSQHNTGLVKSTRNRMPLKIIHTEEYETKTEAHKREMNIKRMKNGIQFRKLVKSRE